MSYTVIRPKDHDGWLAERAKGLGSSDAGTVMGVSPFTTPLELWEMKLGLKPPVPESDAMRNGHFLEPAVAEFFAYKTSSTIDYSTEGDWIAADTQRPYLRVSPDRLFWPEGVDQTPENRLVLEIKSTSKAVDPQNLPLYWVCQVQYQMGILGVKMGAIAWITAVPKLQMDYTWVRFNPAFFETLVNALDHFWNVNIQQGIRPEAISGKDCASLWPTSEDKKIAYATEDDLKACKQYINLNKQLDELEKQIDSVGTSIKKSIQDAETLVFRDPDTGKTTTIARFKSINETVFDEEGLEKKDPEAYLRYMKKYFDKQEFKDEEPDVYKSYISTRKGARRFTVTVK